MKTRLIYNRRLINVQKNNTVTTDIILTVQTEEQKKKSVYSEKHCAIRKTKSRHIIYWSNLPFCSGSVHLMHILFTFLHFPPVGLHEMWHTVQCIYVVWSKTIFFLWSLVFLGHYGDHSGKDRKVLSQQQAPAPLLPLADLQRRPGGHFEYFPHALLSLSGAFQVAKGANAVGHVPALLWFNWLLQNRGVGTESIHAIRFKTELLLLNDGRQNCVALFVRLMTYDVNAAH